MLISPMLSIIPRIASARFTSQRRVLRVRRPPTWRRRAMRDRRQGRSNSFSHTMTSRIRPLQPRAGFLIVHVKPLRPVFAPFRAADYPFLPFFGGPSCAISLYLYSRGSSNEHSARNVPLHERIQRDRSAGEPPV
jgi:hypothetical protein